MNRPMSATISQFRALVTALALLLSANASHAVLLDWANLPGGQTWANGSLNNSYNLDGVAGNDIQIAVVSNGVTFANSGGLYPQNIADPAINSGTQGLQLWTTAGFTNTTNNITVTITFLGTYNTGTTASLTLFDVDASSSFIDRVSITALNGATPVALTATNIGATASNTIAGSGTTNPVVTGTVAVGNISDNRGNVTLSTGAAQVTSITFVWNNPGPNFGSQAIDLGNITFAPEVGSGVAALAVCGAMPLFRRRRRACRAAA